MEGRLGNQLFQYAIARKLSIEFDQDIGIDFSMIEKTTEDLSGGWEDSLKYFNVTSYKRINWKDYLSLTQKIVLLIYISFWKKKVDREKQHKFEIKYNPLLNKFNINWFSLGYNNIMIKNNQNKNIILRGYYESEKYFNDIKKKLMEEFTPKAPLLEKNKALYEKIVNSNSVCISIRRGDVVEKKELASKMYICNKLYFNKALNYLKKLDMNFQYIVFSDDIEWVKENMKFPDGTLFEDGTDPVWEKLRLMYSCKHFIISNSTFSWWAQYLSKNENKIVISPSKWAVNFGDEYLDLINDNFIKIDV